MPPLILNLSIVTINKVAMVKQQDALGLVEIGERIRFERLTKKKPRKPMRAPIHSPTFHSPHSLLYENVSQISKIKEETSYHEEIESSFFESKDEEAKRTVEIKQLDHHSSEFKEVNHKVLERSLNRLTETVTQLKETFGTKVDELHSYVKGNIKYMQQNELKCSVTTYVRKMVGEEVRKQFEAQFEHFKKILLEGEILDNLKVETRGRPRKMLGQNVKKQYETLIVETEPRKKRGRKKKMFAITSPPQKYPDRNQISNADLVSDTRKDYNNNSVCSDNLIYQEESDKSEYVPRNSIKRNDEFVISLATIPKTNEIKLIRDLLPKVPIDSIKTLIDEHRVKM